uniref:Gamma-glutamyltransferase n=1 Tax=Glossina brevipalpis TaxID=37001 RepID=A0A1A9X248_9MUSC
MKIILNKKIVIMVVMSAVLILILIPALIFGLKIGDKNDVRMLGAVVSNGYGCADIGREALYDGGTAIDAAIATLLCEGVVVTHSMGIGGGFVAILYKRSEAKIETVIARESAPAAAHKDMFIGETSITGARAVAVPGEILGYWELHKRYGRLPWKSLFQPTIKLCKEGHFVSKYLAAALKSKEKEIRAEPSLAEVFVKPDNSLYKEGDFLKRPTLAMTLERIANNGAKEIYDGGKTGKMLVKDIQNMGGIITEEDLKNYKVEFKTEHVEAKITSTYKLYTTPLPTSGAVLAFILNVMSGLYTENQDLYWHRVVESYKHAYGQRTNLGDLYNEPVDPKMIKDTFENLISVEFAQKIRELIHDNQTFSDMLYYGANFTNEEDHGTANMAVLAPNGDAITVTSTINNYFGAKVRSTTTGIILNDEMDDFSTPGVVNSFGVPASPANYIHPGKRPLSSMCPSIIIDGQGNARLLVGAAGGTKITTAVAQTIIKYLIFNESLYQAVNDGRLHHQLAPMKVILEEKVPDKIIKYLKSVGHETETSPEGTGFAALTAIGMRSGIPEPYYDNRRVGSTAVLKLNRNNKLLQKDAKVSYMNN